jgi:hypothetical protein
MLPNLRFGEMIQNEALLRESTHEVRSDREVPRIYKDVVGEVEFPEQLDSTQKVGLQQEPIVGFALHDMPNANQFWIPA